MIFKRKGKGAKNQTLAPKIAGGVAPEIWGWDMGLWGR